MGKLTVLKIQQLTRPGQYGDGDCLYLQVKRDHLDRLSRSWVYRFKLNGKRREMGLGPLHLVSLAGARQKVLECRKMHLDGIDPIEVRRAKREQAVLERASAMTFKACAEKYIASHKAGWKNDKHAAQWPSSLNAYAYPMLGALPAHRIDTALVMRVLEPIWSSKPETASRLRGRIELVLDWARVQGYRKGENPARWRGHLDKLLPPRSRVKRRQHHAALPYAEMPAFMARLRQEDGVAARALEFLILTAARTGEVIGAALHEVKDNVWTIPADRMKASKEHRVPLSSPAAAIVTRMLNDIGGHYLFPGRQPSTPLSNMAMLQLLARMGHSGLTAHGFRSTFKDWASETTEYPRELTEMALAHAIGNDVEAAYRRGDLFRKRIALMDNWADFCAGGARSASECLQKHQRPSAIAP